MADLLKQSSTAQPLLFLMIDSSDHVSAKTGLSPTVTLSKAGGAFASPAGAVTEIANGWYKVAGNATDTNTLGPLVLHATASGADPCDVEYAVVAFDPQASTNLGLSGLPTANPAANGGLPTVNGSNYVAGVIAGTTVTTNNDKTGYALSGAGVQAIWDALTSALTTVGSVGKKLADWVLGTDSKALLSTDAQTGVVIPRVTLTDTLTTNSDKTGYSLSQAFPSNFASLGITAGGHITTIDSVTNPVTTTSAIKKNTALSGFTFLLISATDHVTPKAGASITGTVSKDGAAFTALTNTVTELSSGVYVIDLAAADLNANCVMLRFAASGADDRFIEIITQS